MILGNKGFETSVRAGCVYPLSRTDVRQYVFDAWAGQVFQAQPRVNELVQIFSFAIMRLGPDVMVVAKIL